MHILLTGGTGFIGGALTEALLGEGHEIIILSRRVYADRPHCRFIRSLDEIDAAQELTAVINLAGASLAGQRWTSAYKREIIASRTATTQQLLDLFERLHCVPEVLLSASAIGYYGHCGSERLTEGSPPGHGFAAQLCRDWEAVALQAQALGVRVCLLRLGVVLEHGQGALAEMTKSFRLGVASWLGSGNQWFSWVHRQDVVRAIQFLLERSELQGAFNITGQTPVTARDFASALQAHHRTLLKVGVPAPVVRLLLGEMADDLLLQGQRVLPENLHAAGFDFNYPDIVSALAAIYSNHTPSRRRIISYLR